MGPTTVASMHKHGQGVNRGICRNELARPTAYGTTGDPTGRLGHSWTVGDDLMTDTDETWVPDRGVDPRQPE
jgi:hypothetical protein